MASSIQQLPGLCLAIAIALAISCTASEPSAPQSAPTKASTDSVSTTAEQPPQRERTSADTSQVLAALDQLLAMPTRPAANAMDPVALADQIEACCWTGPDNCSQCLDRVAASQRSAGDLWPTLGRFLGPLRDQAELGIEGLGSSLLADGAGKTRDRLFRMAVASSRTRRGPADEQGYRATTLPLVPRAGAPLWLLVEFPAPCPECRGTVTSPDEQGRMDLELSFDCPNANLKTSFEVMPGASRAVWAHRLDVMPAGALTLHIHGNQEPLLRAEPGSPSSVGPQPTAREPTLEPPEPR